MRKRRSRRYYAEYERVPAWVSPDAQRAWVIFDRQSPPVDGDLMPILMCVSRKVAWHVRDVLNNEDVDPRIQNRTVEELDEAIVALLDVRDTPMYPIDISTELKEPRARVYSRLLAMAHHALAKGRVQYEGRKWRVVR